MCADQAFLDSFYGLPPPYASPLPVFNIRRQGHPCLMKTTLNSSSIFMLISFRLQQALWENKGDVICYQHSPCCPQSSGEITPHTAK